MADLMIVRDKVCEQCLFSTAKIVSDARRDEILAQCNRTHESFECHKATIVGEHIVCRAFFDWNCSLSVRLARLLGAWTFGREENHG
jgi:hypothetical protein